MNIARIDVATKKATTVKTQWDVVQRRPYPSISTAHGSLRWQNCDGLLPQYGQDAKGLGQVYQANLLRADFDLNTAQHNYYDYAGSDDAPSFEYRGRSIGQVTAEIDLGQGRPHNGHVWFKGGYKNELTPGERALLNEQVGPALLEYVKRFAHELKARAVEGIQDGVAIHLRDARKRLNEMEDEMKAAVERL